MVQALLMMAQSSLYSSDYSTSYSSSSGDSVSTGAVLAMVGLIYIPLFIIGIIYLIGLWKVFVKAGKPGWAAIVPVYNGMTLAEVAGYPSWWGLGMLISPVSLVLSIIFGMNIAKRFGRSETFGIVALGLFSFVGYLMVGFGKDIYNAEATPTRK